VEVSGGATPNVIVFGGPNGAGKSTTAPGVLRGALSVREFVNADVIARGLSEFNPDAVALTAGRIMLARIRELASERVSFAFETTLASRSFAPWIKSLLTTGYAFRLIYLWLPSPDIAVARVKARVSSGGHNVPEETIRRRYYGGMRNFFELYQPLATSWRWYNNADPTARRLVASGGKDQNEKIYIRKTWQEVLTLVQGPSNPGG
jgi:predicted ABC-type ATPase